MLTAEGLAAGAEDDALDGAARRAGGDAGYLVVPGVVAAELLVPLPRRDHVRVGRQRSARLRLRSHGGHGGAHHHHQHGGGGDQSHARHPCH